VSSVSVSAFMAIHVNPPLIRRSSGLFFGVRQADDFVMPNPAYNLNADRSGDVLDLKAVLECNRAYLEREARSCR
jgi:hypothetical protein